MVNIARNQGAQTGQHPSMSPWTVHAFSSLIGASSTCTSFHDVMQRAHVSADS